MKELVRDQVSGVTECIEGKRGCHTGSCVRLEVVAEGRRVYANNRHEAQNNTLPASSIERGKEIFTVYLA